MDDLAATEPMSGAEHAEALTPVPLMQIATGFWAFKTLAAAHELDLFTRLAGGAETTAQELAHELDIDERPAEMLLTGCASLGLLERGDRGYRNTALSERFLVRGTPYDFGGLVTMFDRRLYPGWEKLTEAIRTNRPTTWDPERERSMFEREDPALLETFWEAMHSLSGFTARTLGDAIDLDAATRLLDVGGGSGAFAIELCRRYPSLSRDRLRPAARDRHRSRQDRRGRTARSHRRARRRLLRRRVAVRARRARVLDDHARLE